MRCDSPRIGIATKDLPDFHMAWFRKDSGPGADQTKVRTEGLWIKCDSCRAIIWKKDLEAAAYVCDKCGFHFKISARDRLRLLFDDQVWEEFDITLRSTDPLEFADQKTYQDRLAAAKTKTGGEDALVSAMGKIYGRTVVVCAMEYAFIGGSMGSVVGEKITRGVERAIAQNTPLIIISASGGARMMEGMVSLVQMAKISSALTRLSAAKLPYISVLTDPTTGGVTASYAMLGDLNVAEPGALIGFAGPRVIEQTIRQKLPKGFQTSEFLLEHGMLDAVVPRTQLKDFVRKAFEFFCAPIQ
jgi:acetyl-CoA carboxylase carboxyl transferase subunit beta